MLNSELLGFEVTQNKLVLHFILIVLYKDYI